MAEQQADAAIRRTGTAMKRRGLLAGAAALVIGIVAKQAAQPVLANPPIEGDSASEIIPGVRGTNSNGFGVGVTGSNTGTIGTGYGVAGVNASQSDTAAGVYGI